MAVINETLHYPSEWLKWEQNGWYSRHDVTILAGSGSARALASGTVLAKITASGKYVQMTVAGAGSAATDGSQTAAAILLFDTTAPVGVDVRAAVIARDAIVSDNGLTWATGIITAELTAATAALVALGIQVREGA